MSSVIRMCGAPGCTERLADDDQVVEFVVRIPEDHGDATLVRPEFSYHHARHAYAPGMSKSAEGRLGDLIERRNRLRAGTDEGPATEE